MSELVQIGDCRENGYSVVVRFGGWRCAYLNNTTDKLSEITYFERHLESDELFVLLEGSCQLLLSPDGKQDYEAIEMKPLLMYNVRQTAYHAVSMRPGCRLLIVENADVNKHNSAFHTLTPQEQEQVQALIRETID